MDLHKGNARAALAGLVTGLALVAAAPPGGHPALAFLAFVPLFDAARAGLRQGALAGWMAGAAFHAAGLAWLPSTIARLQNIGPAGAIGWFALFVAYHAGQFALAGAGAAWLQRARGAAAAPLRGAAALAGTWLLLERSYPKVFPWAVGSALGPSPLLRQAADLAGVYGLTFLVVLVNALLAAALAGGRRAGANRPATPNADPKVPAPLAGEGRLCPPIRDPPMNGVVRLLVVRLLAVVSIKFSGPTTQQRNNQQPYRADTGIGGQSREGLDGGSHASTRALRIEPPAGGRNSPRRGGGSAVRRSISRTRCNLTAARAAAWRPLLAAAALLAAALLYGAGRLARPSPAAAREATIAVVQGNLAAAAPPLAAELDAAWRRYERLTHALPRAADLIVWPERALPVYLRDSPELQQRLAGLLRPRARPLLLGALDAERAAAVERNSAYLMDPGGLAAVRHKVALVPFGEYVPGARWWPALRRWRTTGAFAPGVGDAPIEARLAGVATALGASICFEAIQPGAFNAMVRRGAALLINLTDDAWFASPRAAAQHLEMTRLRAVETRRWLVRASNSGISAFIDPHGDVVASLPFDRAGTLTHRVRPAAATSWYVRCGDAPLFVLAALAIGWALWQEFTTETRRRRDGRVEATDRCVWRVIAGRRGERAHAVDIAPLRAAAPLW